MPKKPDTARWTTTLKPGDIVTLKITSGFFEVDSIEDRSSNQQMPLIRLKQVMCENGSKYCGWTTDRYDASHCTLMDIDGINNLFAEKAKELALLHQRLVKRCITDRPAIDTKKHDPQVDR